MRYTILLLMVNSVQAQIVVSNIVDGTTTTASNAVIFLKDINSIRGDGSGLTGLPSSQPPSANLTNWSTVSTNQYIQTNQSAAVVITNLSNTFAGSSIGVGVLASATSGTITTTNKYDVNRTGSITNVVFSQTGNTNNGIWFPNTNSTSIASAGLEVLTVSNATLRVTGTITNSGANSAGSYNTSGTATAGGGFNAGTSATVISSVNGPTLSISGPGGGSGYFYFTGPFISYNKKLGFGSSGSFPSLYCQNTFELALDSNFIATNGVASYRSNGLAPTSITFPASTVNWTNTQAYSIEVYIDNLTVTGTAITKNGTTILAGLVSGYSMILQPGEYFSETYSVNTPTAKWSPVP